MQTTAKTSIQRSGAVVLFCLALEATAQLHFGTNLVHPGQKVEFRAPMNSGARWEAQKAGVSAAHVSAAFVLPRQCTNLNRGCPLLIVSAPSGISAIRSMAGFTNSALGQGWAVLAADGPPVRPEADTIEHGWRMLESALDQFARTWPPAKRWPVACAGFSGGAKRSASVAAAMMRGGWRVTGVFLGGCNEDRAVLGEQLFQPGPPFKNVAFFISNGDRDPIASPGQGEAVRAALERSGFRVLRTATYAGDHRLHQEHLVEALRWFSGPKPEK